MNLTRVNDNVYLLENNLHKWTVGIQVLKLLLCDDNLNFIEEIGCGGKISLKAKLLFPDIAHQP